jgi:hypothetical protein
VVTHEDPAAIARAIRVILTQADLADRMRHAAAAAAAETTWADVARTYGRLGSELRSAVAA